MKIHVHLGAHKTATTFIQSQLHDNRVALAQTGIGVVELAEIRKKFSHGFEILNRFDPFWAPVVRPLLARRLNALLEKHRDKEVVILSDENLAGLIRVNYISGGLYRSLGKRAGLLKKLLAGHDVRFFFAIRPYPDYLTSSYLQLASRGRAPSFSRYLSRLPQTMPGWGAAVTDLSGAVGAESLTVWTYEWFKQDPARLLGLLAPGSSLEVPEQELRREVLPSLTRKGFEVLQRLEGQLSRGELQRMGKLLRAFPFDEPNERLDITDPGLLAAYDAKYAGEIANIRKLGVSFHEA
jgi:hypothetical protein